MPIYFNRETSGSMTSFLVSLIILVVLFRGGAYIIRLRSGEKQTIQESYNRFLLYFFCALGIVFAAVSGLIFMLALSDQFGFSHFGYSVMATIFSGIFMLLGFSICRLANKFLSQKRKL